MNGVFIKVLKGTCTWQTVSGYVIDLLPEGGCLLSEVFNTPMLRVGLRMLKLPKWPRVEMCSLCMRVKLHFM